MNSRVKRQEDLYHKPSADSSRELHRRNASPGYMAARVIQGVDWNRDAYLSQQSYNHAVHEARKMEKAQVAEKVGGTPTWGLRPKYWINREEQDHKVAVV